jgi:hypothetical protein
MQQQMRQQGMANPMQRDPSNMDMAGQRPQTPGDAPSPSKRQRTDGANFDGQGMQARPGMPSQQMLAGNNLMLQNGMGGDLNQGQLGFVGPNGQKLEVGSPISSPQTSFP